MHNIDIEKNLSDQAKAMLKNRYMLPEENGKPCDVLFERAATAYSSDEQHRNAILSYMKSFWFMPSTPILSNAGSGSTGMPISCFVNEVEDSIYLQQMSLHL
jgi:ribonucleoside-diphosphate reductase alpha chain